MDGVFAGAVRVAVVLPPQDRAGPGLRDIADLIRQETYEFEVELGAPVEVSTAAPVGRPRLTLAVDPDTATPTLTLDRERAELVAGGADLPGVIDAVNLLRTLRTRRLTSITSAPVDDLDQALDVVEHEIATTYPSFGLRGLDWPALTRQHRPHVDAADPLPGLQRWVATLGDAHTHIREIPRHLPLPYTARVVDGRVRFGEVPEGTAASDAGVVTDDELLDVDVADLWSRTGAPAHLRPWDVGRRALSGAPGQALTVRVARQDGTVAQWSEVPTPEPWPEPIEVGRLASGTGYLRIRRWTTDDAERLDEAVDELASAPRLIVDLRSNPGGQLVAATAFRSRFLSSPTRLGSIRFSTGDGSLSPPGPVIGEPSERRRWWRPVRFLTDALTYSGSEDAILGLQQLPEVAVVGLPSGGGSGRARTMPLLPGTVLSVSTALTYDHAGRCVEDRGIHVDHLIAEVLGDVAIEAADRTW